MKFRSSQPRRSPIGIDAGPRYFAAVQMDEESPRPRIAAALLLPREQFSAPLSHSEIKPLPTILRRAGFSGNKIVLAAPLDKQFGGILEMPSSDTSAYTQISRIELARTNRCAPDSLEMDCWPVPEIAGKSAAHVMAVGCRHDDASKQLDLFESAGFDAHALDIRAAALSRAAALLPPSPGMTAILDISWPATLLVLVCDGDVVFERRLADTDLQRVHEALVQRLHVETELADYLLLEAGLDAMPGDAPAARSARTILSGYLDGLATELATSMGYATEKYDGVAIMQLLLCGDAAAMPGICSRLGDRLKLATRTISPADLCTAAQPVQAGQSGPAAGNSPALAAAMGLAL
ncbi:MAG TPA: pilus assembly protein PilM [Tepidisphaeraceae bacterium]|jgi:Tfp pilus assembly PilM family ATPase|nr:pilus assembly protein PilM [Tepidisphaeraceae bacterium]